VLAGRLPASTKGHFYWLKVAGGCRARQQKPVLAARTNRFWPSVLWAHGRAPTALRTLSRNIVYLLSIVQKMLNNSVCENVEVDNKQC
jgi:hypothetical protein